MSGFGSFQQAASASRTSANANTTVANANTATVNTSTPPVAASTPSSQVAQKATEPKGPPASTVTPQATAEVKTSAATIAASSISVSQNSTIEAGAAAGSLPNNPFDLSSAKTSTSQPGAQLTQSSTMPALSQASPTTSSNTSNTFVHSAFNPPAGGLFGKVTSGSPPTDTTPNLFGTSAEAQILPNKGISTGSATADGSLFGSNGVGTNLFRTNRSTTISTSIPTSTPTTVSSRGLFGSLATSVAPKFSGSAFASNNTSSSNTAKAEATPFGSGSTFGSRTLFGTGTSFGNGSLFGSLGSVATSSRTTTFGNPAFTTAFLSGTPQPNNLSPDNQPSQDVSSKVDQPDTRTAWNGMFYNGGDVQITAKYDGNVVTGTVYSAAMALASSVWKELFFPELEAANRENGKVESRVSPKPALSNTAAIKELDLSDDDGDALLVVLNLVHQKFGRLPATPLPYIDKIAVLCYKYDCVHLFGGPWLSSWLRLNDLTESPRVEMLFTAWVFGQQQLFHDIASLMVKKICVSVDGKALTSDGLPIKYDLLPVAGAVERIVSTQQATIEKLFQVLYNKITRYASSPNILCVDQQQICHDVTLGSLTRHAYGIGLLPNKGTATQFNDSLETLANKIRGFHITETFHYNGGCHGYGSSIVLEVDDIMNSIPSLVEDSDREHLEKQRKKLESNA